MTIGEIGMAFPFTDRISYLSNTTLIDFDIIIVSFNSILSGFDSNVIYNLDTKQKFEKRKEDIKEFLFHKKNPLIIFAPLPKEINFEQINDYETKSLDFFLPIPEFKVARESGKTFNIINNTPFSEFFRKHINAFQYESYFTTKIGKVILETPYTKKVLGFYNDDSIFLPQFKSGLNADLKKLIFDDLIEIVSKLRFGRENPLPEWANQYLLPLETIITKEVSVLQEEIEQKKREIEVRVEKLQRMRELKILFTGTGSDLEREVEELFKKLGFKIISPMPNRDDIIIKYDDRIAVIEVKGLSGSAAEKHLAQLEKWAMNYFAESGIQPKAILIINPYKDEELKSRNSEIWPHQMLKLSNQREHCLITTLQLLNIYYEVEANPLKKEELINTLFETIGIYQGFNDWSMFIEFSS